MFGKKLILNVMCFIEKKTWKTENNMKQNIFQHKGSVAILLDV